MKTIYVAVECVDDVTAADIDRLLTEQGNRYFPTYRGAIELPLSMPACPACGRLNPHEAAEPAPDRCRHCHSDMSLTPHAFVPGRSPVYCDACDHNRANTRLHP